MKENLRTLHKRIRVPKIKQEYVFWFCDAAGLKQHNGGLGRDKRIYYSPTDYDVVEDRQKGNGPTEDLKEHFE